MLDKSFNVAVLHIASKCLPCGFDVSDKAPSTLAELVAHYDATGRILVWSGASDQTIFGDAEVNYAFRAWHDSKHLLGRYAFDRHGEIDACQDQINDVIAAYGYGETGQRFASYLGAEIVGQFDYNAIHGKFPVDQERFVRAYLRSPWRAVATKQTED